MMTSRFFRFLCVLGISLTVSTCGAKDWVQWRGPNGNGIADANQEPPTAWNAGSSLWKVAVPGRGHSSPIVVGDVVYLQSADERNQVQAVIAFDKATGKKLGAIDVNKGGFPGRIHNKNTHASPTLACNGSSLFASFCNHDSVQLSSITLKGKIGWQKVVGPFKPGQYKYGYAASPAIYKDLVIVAADYDGGGYIAAFDQKSGTEKWNTKRPRKTSYSSPVVAKVAGKDQLLISGCDEVSSYDPASGRKLWSVEGTTMATCGTMVWDGDLVFASGGYPKSETIAVNAANGQVAWRNRSKCYEQSMLASGGSLYGVTDQGIAYCWNAASGNEAWKTRLGGPISASPVLANGLIYQSNERGTTWVFEATPTGYKEVSRNQLGDESFASPTIVDSRIYLRVTHREDGKRQEYLYCFGK
jgi:outer membrane protein assembly factor BamB